MREVIPVNEKETRQAQTFDIPLTHNSVSNIAYNHVMTKGENDTKSAWLASHHASANPRAIQVRNDSCYAFDDDLNFLVISD